MGDPLRKRQRLDLSDLKPAGAGGGAGGDGGGEGVNPHTGQAYSRRYHEILAKRRGLPVYEFLDDLLGKVKKNQVRAFLCFLGGEGGGCWGCVSCQCPGSSSSSSLTPPTQYTAIHTTPHHVGQVVVVEGETGSGKTTQIPQFMVDAGYTKVRFVVGGWIEGFGLIW